MLVFLKSHSSSSKSWKGSHSVTKKNNKEVQLVTTKIDLVKPGRQLELMGALSPDNLEHNIE